ncbi:MAG: hypothetical protein RL207_1466 [Bacteroidota bacterium]
MKTYRIKRSSTLFARVFNPLFMGLMILILVWTIDSDVPMSFGFIVLQIVIFLIVFLMSLIKFIESLSWSMIIDEERVSILTKIARKELAFDEIKGYREHDQYLILVPNNPDKKNLTISRSLENYPEFFRWVSEKFSDLDAADAREEKEQILTKEAYGKTVEQRERKLARASSLTVLLNIIGGITVAWMVFFSSLYAVYAVIFVPLLCLLVFRLYKGLIRFEVGMNSPHPSISIGVMLPIIGIGHFVYEKLNILNFSYLWAPTLIFFSLFVATLTFRNKAYAQVKDFYKFGLFAVFMLAYVISVLISLNCMLDDSKPETYKAVVLGKRKMSRSMGSILEVSAWGPQKINSDLKVNDDYFEYTDLKDTVLIELRKGEFNLPWFKIK